jgi:hypothetical protein
VESGGVVRRVSGLECVGWRVDRRRSAEIVFVDGIVGCFLLLSKLLLYLFRCQCCIFLYQ